MSKELILWQENLKKSSALEINNMMLDENSITKKQVAAFGWYPIASALPIAFTGVATLAASGFIGWAIGVGLAISAVGVLCRSWNEYTPSEAFENSTLYHSSEAFKGLTGEGEGNYDCFGEKLNGKKAFTFVSKPNIFKTLNPLRFFMKTKTNEYIANDAESGIATKYTHWASFFSARFERREYLSDRAVFNRTVANLELES